MPLRALQGGLLTCALLVSACGCTAPTSPSDTPAPTAAVSMTPMASAIVDLTNAERGRAGLGTVRAEARLTRAAQLQAEQNARAGRIDHVLPEAQYPRPEDRLAAAGYPWQAYGENLAFGYPDAPSVVESWMHSTGHRANMLAPSFTEIGIGLALDASGRRYFAQIFARPR
jgi:uncharacterized protein YkwD